MQCGTREIVTQVIGMLLVLRKMFAGFVGIAAHGVEGQRARHFR